MIRLYLLLFSILFFCSIQLYAQTDTLRIENGLITGVKSDEPSVHLYKGIPYARAPVGKLRWRPPLPPQNWDGVYRASRFGPTCMQVLPPEGSFYQLEFYREREPMSEDCLYLNVWTSKNVTGGKKPVMMWIHGGAFRQGSGSLPSFNGASFAKNGVVLVTFNYRLDVFGLFAHPDLTGESEHNASGNYGLLDAVAALGWIQGNIEYFGGDPDNVTIFGQSAGADNVNKLMVSPLAKGLFHKAILQSGTSYTFGKSETLNKAEVEGVNFARKLEAKNLEELRNISASRLLESAQGFSFTPNIDRWLLPRDVISLIDAGNYNNRVPLITGFNEDEGTALHGPNLNTEIFKHLIGRSYGDTAEEFLRLYPHQTDEEAKRSFNKGWRDEMAWGAHTLARKHLEHGKSGAWLYHFSKVPPGPDSERYGAFHSAELVYVFDRLEAVDRPWTATDEEIAELMNSYWTRFAATGNPNGEDLPHWPAYNPDDRNALEIGESINTHKILREEILEFYNKRFTEQ